MLVVVQAPFQVEWSRSEWLEDELVRAGARAAHLIDDAIVAVTVVASSTHEAHALVADLLARVGALPSRAAVTKDAKTSRA